MKICWLINVPLPVVSVKKGYTSPVICGWLFQTADIIGHSDGISLTVIYPQDSEHSLQRDEIDGINYVGFYQTGLPSLKYSEELEKIFKDVTEEYGPDIVHIWGTEYVHSLAMVKAFDNPEKTVISIQGLISEYAKYYMADLPHSVQRRYTLRDLRRHDNLLMQQKKYEIRGIFEIEAVKSVRHVFGRTSWDRMLSKSYNPDVIYHRGGEILRRSFYGDERWRLEKCDRYSIFVSQYYYPIKGFHYLLQALPGILKKYPETKIRVAGGILFKGFRGNLKDTYYLRYLKKLIRQYPEVQSAVTFLGTLDEKAMKKEYLGAHVFLIPSAIENSPNSLAEAMMLGVPCVASNVGGIPDMLEHGKEGIIYSNSDASGMIESISRIFDSDEFAGEISENASVRADIDHNIERCTGEYLAAYDEILNGSIA